MVIAQRNKCAMCGKDTVGRGKPGKYNKENGNEQEQQQENNSSLFTSLSTVIAVEQINGLYYTFDTASCALMFKKFMDMYGSNFAYDD